MTMRKLNLKFVSELIGDDYKNWKLGDVVSVKSQTGTGKNYFTFNVLLKNLGDYERMLYICNRSALKNESKLDLYRVQGIEIPIKSNKTDWKSINSIGQIGRVVIMSYQQMENQQKELNYGLSEYYTDFNKFKYCVFDECHYLQNDSWNCSTDISMNKIMKSNHTIKIFISATMEVVNKKINELVDSLWGGKHYTYNQSLDYSYITPFIFHKDEDLINTIAKDQSDDKWVIFVTGVDKGKTLQKLIPNSVFVKSGSDTSEIVETNSFSQKVLISTSVLDNGINLKDSGIKNVVIYGIDRVKIIQMLGRVRFTAIDGAIYANDLNLYIPKLWKNSINGYLSQRLNQIEIIDMFHEDYNKWECKYGRDLKKLDKLFYRENGELKVNQNYLRSLKVDETMYKIILEQMEDNIDYPEYKRFKWLGIDYRDAVVIKDTLANEDEIKDFLERNIGRHYDKKFKNELAEMVKATDKRKRIVNTVDVVNVHVNDMYPNKYLITSQPDRERRLEDGSVNPNRDKIYISITKIS